jgi:hypothetical protein
MNALKLKPLVYSVSILSAIWLAGCTQKTPEQVVPDTDANSTTVQPASTETAPQPISKETSAQNQENLGLFAGKFDPTREYLIAKSGYEKWTHEQSGEEGLDFEYSRDLNDTPAEYRSYMFKHPLYGYYDFVSPNRLSIVIDEIRDDGSFSARSVAAGNKRTVTGKWKKLDYGWHLSGAEPGDDENDGKFEMVLTRTKLIGMWTPNKENAPTKEFTLIKTYFDYDPEIGQGKDGRFYVDLGRSGFEKNPSVDKLETADVENLKQPTIRIIRNLIFARHGYSFANKDLRLIFEGYDWYTPVSNNVKAELTETEKANLALLVRYEEYADKNYDEFGR